MNDAVKISVDNCVYQIALPNKDTDYIQGKIATDQQPYEIDMLRDLATRLQKNNLVLDIGANIGNHSLYLAANCGCRVHAFEPNPDLCEGIKRSIRLNNMNKQITVHQVGVGAQSGKAHFAVSNQENLGAQSLAVTNLEQDAITIIAIDSLNISDKVNAIKIDVEGMELDVLNGARQLIERDHPILYVEAQTEADFISIHSWLSEAGYCYWDTFNATPTHLFLHNSTIQPEQRFDRMLFKSVREEYRAAQSVAALREKLIDANAKYRMANEKIDDLKQKLDTVNLKYRDLSGASTELKKDVELKSLTYQSEILTLKTALLDLEKNHVTSQTKLEQSNFFSAEIKKQFDELAIKKSQLVEQLSDVQQRLEDAYAKYRVANENISKLKAELDAERTKLRNEKNILENTIVTLKADSEKNILQLKETVVGYERALLESNKKLETETKSRVAATENITELTSRINNLSQQKEKIASHLTEVNALLDNSRMENGDLQGRVRSLEQQLQELRDKYTEVMQSLADTSVLLNAEISKNRDLTQNVESLSAQLVALGAHRNQIQQELSQCYHLLAAEELQRKNAQDKTHTLTAELAQLHAQHELGQKNLANFIKMLEQERLLSQDLGKELSQSRDTLRQLQLLVEREQESGRSQQQLLERSSAEILALKQQQELILHEHRDQVALLSATHHRQLQLLEEREQENERSQRQLLERLSVEIAALNQQQELILHEHRDQVASLSATHHQLMAAEVLLRENVQYSVQVLSAELTQLQNQHELELKKLATLSAEHHELVDGYKELAEDYQAALQGLDEHKKLLANSLSTNSQQGERIVFLDSALATANEKYRQASGVEIPALKERNQAQATRLRELQQHIDAINRELSKANQKRTAAEKRIHEIRASLTYKLGNLIRTQSQSITGLLKLPLGLWRLYRQHQLRKLRPAARATSAPAKIPAAIFANEPPVVVTAPLAVHNVDTLQLSAEPARNLRIACIMDDFTFSSYQPECVLQQLTPDNWQDELTAFSPEILFIESAWRGKDALWGSKVGHNSQEVQGIIAWCKARQIPTLFWNKEDPVHFETFLNTAKLFDYVFTTDIDCIHRYKAGLGHERVFLLPFACQPSANNPIEKYQRKDAFCFAGAYYVRYPQRTRDLETFVAELPRFRPLEIYDRNYGKNDENYQFPAHYQPYIVGTLPFSEIDKAYKGYRYAINLNSIKQSQTMFARRVFELLASNTLTISNFSRGVRLLFGDLVITSDSGQEVVKRLTELADTDSKGDRLRLAALRKVMLEHTYSDRLNYIIAKIRGHAYQQQLCRFSVFAQVNNQIELQSIIGHVQRQENVIINLQLFCAEHLIADDIVMQLRGLGITGSCQSVSSIHAQRIADFAVHDAWVTAFLPSDYYGKNYLLDIALATRYSQAKVIGKAAYHQWQTDSIELLHAELAYRPAIKLPMRAAAVAFDVAQSLPLKSWLDNISTAHYEQEKQLAIDPYNYCQSIGAAMEMDAKQSQLLKELVDDLPLNTGLSFAELTQIAESIKPLASAATNTYSLSPHMLNQLIGDVNAKQIAIELVDEGIQITSQLSDAKHEYVYAKTDLARAELMQGRLDEDSLPLYVDMEPGLNISLVLLFLDVHGQRISHIILTPNRNHTVDLPIETTHIRLGWRIYSGGQAIIKQLLLSHRDLQPAHILGQADILLVTNHYPSYDDLYRNGFVHSRVKAYRQSGVAVDVFRLRKDEPLAWHEFENQDVTTGSQEALRRMLASGRYRHVLVHFLDPNMWDVLVDFIDTIKVTVWVHGAEVQPWWRREYNYTNEQELAIAKIESEKRLGFWKKIFDEIPNNLKFVFVSKYFADEVIEDVGISLPQSAYEIIHNPIDTDIFSYEGKSIEQRKKILSIRPYASAKYANDLSVDAILELAKKPWFSKLEFRMIGDGKLFDEILEPVKNFKNVVIERKFLSQLEIAKLHKDYGLFLCPTRMDAQGVSRDEAMASGLVPITNAVTAIPEFVDETCGILAAGEDAVGMANGVAALYEHPDVFLSMSAAAAVRVRHQSAAAKIIHAELQIIK